MAETGAGYRERNSTTDRTLTILDMFNDHRLQITAAEVTDRLEVARSTAYRYLQSLVASGFLEEAGTGGFRLGMRVVELSRLARRGFGLSDIAVPIMQSLADRYHVTVLLTRRAGTNVVCVERAEAAGQYVRLSYERGTLLPINAGASALAVLAWLPEDEVRRLLAEQPPRRLTTNTLTDVDAILRRLATIRADGFSVTHAEVDRDAVGIAAPIFTGGNEVISSLSAVLLSSRTTERELELVVRSVREGAARISRTLALVEQ